MSGRNICDAYAVVRLKPELAQTLRDAGALGRSDNVPAAELYTGDVARTLCSTRVPRLLFDILWDSDDDVCRTLCRALASAPSPEDAAVATMLCITGVVGARRPNEGAAGGVNALRTAGLTAADVDMATEAAPGAPGTLAAQGAAPAATLAALITAPVAAVNGVVHQVTALLAGTAGTAAVPPAPGRAAPAAGAAAAPVRAQHAAPVPDDVGAVLAAQVAEEHRLLVDAAAADARLESAAEQALAAAASDDAPTAAVKAVLRGSARRCLIVRKGVPGCAAALNVKLPDSHPSTSLARAALAAALPPNVDEEWRTAAEAFVPFTGHLVATLPPRQRVNAVLYAALRALSSGAGAGALPGVAAAAQLRSPQLLLAVAKRGAQDFPARRMIDGDSALLGLPRPATSNLCCAIAAVQALRAHQRGRLWCCAVADAISLAKGYVIGSKPIAGLLDIAWALATVIAVPRGVSLEQLEACWSVVAENLPVIDPRLHKGCQDDMTVPYVAFQELLLMVARHTVAVAAVDADSALLPVLRGLTPEGTPQQAGAPSIGVERWALGTDGPADINTCILPVGNPWSLGVVSVTFCVPPAAAAAAAAARSSDRIAAQALAKAKAAHYSMTLLEEPAGVEVNVAGLAPGATMQQALERTLGNRVQLDRDFQCKATGSAGACASARQVQVTALSKATPCLMVTINSSMVNVPAGIAARVPLDILAPINIAPFMLANLKGALGAASWPEPTADAVMLDLYGFAVYSGNGSSGHYTWYVHPQRNVRAYLSSCRAVAAYTSTFESTGYLRLAFMQMEAYAPTLIPESWHEINDDTVTAVDSAKVAAAAGMACMAMYAATGVDSHAAIEASARADKALESLRALAASGAPPNDVT